MTRRILSPFLALFAIFLASTVASDRAVATTEKTLHSFAPFAHGEFPYGLIADTAGNFYGTAESGGAFNQGPVDKIGAGNLYGTTAGSGDNQGAVYQGTVFEITP